MSRYVWGPYGAFLHIVQRIVLGLVWFAVQSWTGGLCISVMLSAIFPSFHALPNVFPAGSNLETKRFVGWVLFNVVQAPVLYIPPHKIKNVLHFFNATSALTLVAMMIWAMNEVKGGGPLLSQGNKPMSSWDLGWSMVQAVSTVIGGIAVGLTNANDYSRFARRPGDQVFGQWFSIMYVIPCTYPGVGKSTGLVVTNRKCIVCSGHSSHCSAVSRRLHQKAYGARHCGTHVS